MLERESTYSWLECYVFCLSSVLAGLCRYQYLPSLVSPLSTFITSQQRTRVKHMCPLSLQGTQLKHQDILVVRFTLIVPVWLFISFLITLIVSCVEQTFITLHCTLWCLVWVRVRCVVCSGYTDWVQAPRPVVIHFKHADLDWTLSRPWTSRKY